MSYYEPYGDEVGPGWRDIVLDVHKQLSKLDPGYRIDQIKEKFGGLRYYYTPTVGYDHPTARLMEDVVSQAEEQASRTCEWCGQPGTPRPLRWVKTLCDEHAAVKDNLIWWEET